MKNERGLWVKSSKLPESNPSPVMKSKGRGGGVPALFSLHTAAAREARMLPRPGDDDASDSDREATGRKRMRADSSFRVERRNENSRTHRSQRRRSRSRSPVDRATRALISTKQTSPTPDDSENAFFFNAVQLTNRFLDVFSAAAIPVEKKADLLSELFADSMEVCSLKSRRPLLLSKSALLESFQRVTFHVAHPSRRVFIEAAAGAVSFCLDFHCPHSAPGLGDPSKDSCLLYRCERSKITHVWGGVDKELLASLTSLSLARVKSSEVWRQAVVVIGAELGELDDNLLHFHDYTNIEVIG